MALWKRTARNVLNRSRYRRPQQQYVDHDYTDQLTEDELEWLARFYDMLYNSKDHTEFFGIDNTDNKYMREIYASRNAQDRDLYTYERIGGRLDSYEHFIEHQDSCS